MAADAFPSSPPSPGSRALAILTEAARAVHGPSEPNEKLRWFVDAVSEVTSADLAAYIDIRGVAGGSSVVTGTDETTVERFARPPVVELVLSRATAASAQALASAAGDAGREVGFAEVFEDHGEHLPQRAEALLSDVRFRSFLDRTGLGSSPEFLLVPVHGSDGLLHGVLLVGRRRRRAFDATDESALLALAAHVGIAIDNFATVSRLTEIQEIQREVVHELQEAVRPPLPAVELAELGVYYLPADPSSPTGGDLYDCLVLPNGDLHLAVVDVMGKGVAATKDAVLITHALRLLVLEGCSMNDLVARAAELASAQAPEMVATVLVARYRPSDGVLQLAGGGHPPAVVVSKEGDARFVAAPGMAIGWPGSGSDEVTTITLDRKDTIILYTDGLIEADKDILVGLEGITRAAAQTARYPANHLARALVERALSGAMRRDDSLALVLRRRSPPKPDPAPVLAPFEYRFSPSPATVPLGRHLFTDWLEHLSMDEGERSDLILVASELCSNAVRHSSGAAGAVALRAWADGDSVVVEVEDDGAGFELDGHYDDEIPDLEAERGRGLYVVEALTDEISVNRVADRTVVRAVRRAVLPVG